MTDKPETVSLYQFFQRFPDEEAARLYFERNRWGDEPVCGHCGSLNVVNGGVKVGHWAEQKRAI